MSDNLPKYIMGGIASFIIIYILIFFILSYKAIYGFIHYQPIQNEDNPYSGGNFIKKNKLDFCGGGTRYNIVVSYCNDSGNNLCSSNKAQYKKLKNIIKNSS
jgi:hypothetical protein